MTNTDKVIITDNVTTRGPGGHYNSYRAYFIDESGGPYGYGATIMEATRSLLKAEEELKAVVAPATNHFGWFVYVRHNGRLSHHKYIVEGDRVHADTKKYYESFELKKFQLTKAEWELPLDQLAEKYPLPREFGDGVQ